LNPQTRRGDNLFKKQGEEITSLRKQVEEITSLKTRRGYNLVKNKERR
jgi:hypothetical protein